MIAQDASKIAMGEVEYQGIPALFSDLRIDRGTVPSSLSFYEIRHTDDDWAKPAQISNEIMVNFYGTLLTTKPLDMPDEGIFLDDNPFEITSGNIVTLDEFLEDMSIDESGRTVKETAKLGEDMACHYLRDNEVEVIERNWKCESGEADIIAEEDGDLVFVEVKTRSQGYPGLPEYATTADNRARNEMIAISYLKEHPRPSGSVRFDIIAIQMTGPSQCLLRHHRSAYSTDDVERAPSKNKENARAGSSKPAHTKTEPVPKEKTR